MPKGVLVLKQLRCGSTFHRILPARRLCETKGISLVRFGFWLRRDAVQFALRPLDPLVSRQSGLVRSRSTFYGDHPITAAMPQRDTNQEAVRNVDRATDSEPINGEDLALAPFRK